MLVITDIAQPKTNSDSALEAVNRTQQTLILRQEFLSDMFDAFNIEFFSYLANRTRGNDGFITTAETLHGALTSCRESLAEYRTALESYSNSEGVDVMVCAPHFHEAREIEEGFNAMSAVVTGSLQSLVDGRAR